MINRIRHKIICLCLILCFAALPQAVYAWEGDEEPADMTVSLVYEEGDGKTAEKIPLEGANVLLFKVASLALEDDNFQYILEESYADTGLDLNTMTAAKSLDAAKLLEQVIRDKGLEPYTSGVTDSSGQITFTGLEPGMYLGIQEEKVIVKDKSVFFGASLWMVPEGEQDDNGVITWNYSVTVYPKVAPEIEDTPTPTPTSTPTPTPTPTVTATATPPGKNTSPPPRSSTKTPTPKRSVTSPPSSGRTTSDTRKGTNVKTGDQSRIELFACLVIISLFVIGMVFIRKRNKKK